MRHAASSATMKHDALTDNFQSAATRDAAERRRELSALLPLWPKDLDDVSVAGRTRVIALMERALRAERRRGRAGHWAYDLARHAALYRAWKLECAELKAMAAANWKRVASQSRSR
ncbi:MAG: hypothetical protein ACT4OU_06235 [Hyphomicrobium sp.]